MSVGLLTSTAQFLTVLVSSFASNFRKQCGFDQIHSVTVPLRVSSRVVSKLAAPWCAAADTPSHPTVAMTTPKNMPFTLSSVRANDRTEARKAQSVKLLGNPGFSVLQLDEADSVSRRILEQGENHSAGHFQPAKLYAPAAGDDFRERRRDVLDAQVDDGGGGILPDRGRQRRANAGRERRASRRVPPEHVGVELLQPRAVGTRDVEEH